VVALLVVLLLAGVVLADADWAESGSATVVWGTTYCLEFEGLSYNITPDDFSRQVDSVFLSVLCGGSVREAILHENECFEWGDRIMIKLTDISTDSSKTPRAHLTFYKGDSLELDLELTLSVSKEVHGDLTISSSQYAPREDKTLKLTIKNTGNSDIDDLEVCVGGGMLLEDMEPDEIGALAPGASERVVVTVRAPDWDGDTSPYLVNYSVDLVVSGEMNDQTYTTNESVKLYCTNPLLRVVRSLNPDEIEIGDEVVMRAEVYNMGFYPVSGVNLSYGAVLDTGWIINTSTSGSLDSIGHYSVRHTVLPDERGTYKLGRATAALDFFGRDFAWSSDAVDLVVHGATITITKTVSQRSNSTYDALVTVKNTGDRSAQITVHDSVPAGYVDGSVEEAVNERGGVLVSPSKLDVGYNGGAHTINITGIVLNPSEHVKMPYQLILDDFNHTDIPFATVRFGTRNGYANTLQSSHWLQGVKLPPPSCDLAGAPPEPEPTPTPTATANVTATTMPIAPAPIAPTAPAPTVEPGAPTPSQDTSPQDIAAMVRRGMDQADAKNRESPPDLTVDLIKQPSTSKFLYIVLIALVAGVAILLVHRKLVRRGAS
jgi:hypothetical protein